MNTPHISNLQGNANQTPMRHPPTATVNTADTTQLARVRGTQDSARCWWARNTGQLPRKTSRGLRRWEKDQAMCAASQPQTGPSGRLCLGEAASALGAAAGWRANTTILEKTLIAVSIPLEGKKQMWRHDVIPILVHLLRDPVEEVKANVAGALMYATVTTEGKYAALDADAIHSLLGLLVSSLQKARLNAVKALTMLAEAPEGRKILKAHVHAFRVLEVEDPSKTVQRAAQVAIKVIEWRP
ncbi:PREDICTED: radial spoke head 14 homolog [Myotis davidii]|uniref:radial spoke head 14 homolog n=1 Tax=Myotis davidii TaxID=225400 RepID=UPI0003EC2529|nr:PREDICTED: radial spoke head 14 homolog [Myotis davidii]